MTLTQYRRPAAAVATRSGEREAVYLEVANTQSIKLLRLLERRRRFPNLDKIEVYLKAMVFNPILPHRPMDVAPSFLPLSLTADRYHDTEANRVTKTGDRRR